MEATCEFLRSFGCLECDLERLRDIERERERETRFLRQLSAISSGVRLNLTAVSQER